MGSELKYHQREVYEVTYSDLEQYLREQFPMFDEISVVAAWEEGNDSAHEVELKKDSLLDYEKKYLAEMKGGGADVHSYSGPNLLMYDLAEQGKIPWGVYIVKICW